MTMTISSSVRERPSFISSGAQVTPIYVERQVVYYAVNEAEMNSLSPVSFPPDSLLVFMHGTIIDSNNHTY